MTTNQNWNFLMPQASGTRLANPTGFMQQLQQDVSNKEQATDSTLAQLTQLLAKGPQQPQGSNLQAVLARYGVNRG